jgi:DNA-binding MarR family transcriptional regulator
MAVSFLRENFPERYFLDSFLSSHLRGSYDRRVTKPQDAVDRITEQWRAARPDLDSSPMGVFGRITRIAALAERQLESVFTRFGLAGGDFDVLATLRRAEPPYRLTPGELSRSTMVTTGGMTKRLDRLEAAGLIRREPDPRDRRGKLIALSDEGRALMDEAIAAHVANEHRLLADLPPAQRERLAALLRELLLSLEGPR